MPRLEQRRLASVPGDDADEVPSIEAQQWGVDDDGPIAAVTLAADLPAEAPADDPDPLTYPIAVDGPATLSGEDVASVVGVRFVTGGRVQWFDAGEGEYAVGERVVVDSDRGQRLGWVAVAPTRRATRDPRGLRRVVRRANEHDLRGERAGEADVGKALRIAKDKAAGLRLALKVFRVELTGPLGRAGGGTKANVYYTSDERLDLRDFIRDLGNAFGARIEMRQLGVRDEAKAVGGIGSCGLTLCCTTWLPDFVPVSIKMAKDQGLVLSPTKVSGQCGRLKCCLVYEQAAYAELRKGLPKLGKRVYATRGEGRIVEVDVLRQRVRVSYGPGDSEVLPAAEVRPMFPPGNAPGGGGGGGDGSDGGRGVRGGAAPTGRDPRAPRSNRGPAPPDLRGDAASSDLPGGTVNSGPPVLRELAADAADAEDDIIDPAEATDDPRALAKAPIQPSFVGGAPSPLDIEEADGGDPPLSEALAEATDTVPAAADTSDALDDGWSDVPVDDVPVDDAD